MGAEHMLSQAEAEYLAKYCLLCEKAIGASMSHYRYNIETEMEDEVESEMETIKRDLEELNEQYKSRVTSLRDSLLLFRYMDHYGWDTSQISCPGQSC